MSAHAPEKSEISGRLERASKPEISEQLERTRAELETTERLLMQITEIARLAIANAPATIPRDELAGVLRVLFDQGKALATQNQQLRSLLKSVL